MIAEDVDHVFFCNRLRWWVIQTVLTASECLIASVPLGYKDCRTHIDQFYAILLPGALYCIIPLFARPIPSCLYVRDKSEHCEKGERLSYDYYGEPIISYHWATQGTHLQPPMTTCSPQTGISQPPVKTCIANCCQTVPDTRVVCIDSLWEHAIALSSGTIVDPIGTPLPLKVGGQKVNSKLL